MQKVLHIADEMHNPKIWEKVLSTDEKVEYEFTVSARYRKTGLIIWSIISAWFLILFIVLLVAVKSPWALLTGCVYLLPFIGVFNYGFYKKAANAYAFTNKRVLMHRGLFSTHMISVDYNKITEVRVSEPFFGRIFFKMGTISICTAGTSSIDIFMKHIQNPYEIKKRLDHLKDQ